ncbi:MAG: hypothetical protein K1X81_14300 [Bacteroidia bacterium]|nr:hypothetical protein [Bacteroidia bacterium]
MSHIKLLLLLASLSCLSLHCKKESELDKLPAATNYGAKTCGCLINGKAFRGDRYSKLFEGTYHDAMVEMEVELEDERIYFRTEGIITKAGDYFIPCYAPAKHLFVFVNTEEYYASDFNPTGYAFLRITRLDSLQHIIAGQFDFTLFNTSGTASVHVSNGRFDLRYAP